MLNTRIKIGILFFIVALVVYSCENKLADPVAVNKAIYPAKPTHLTSYVGDKYVKLTWESPSKENVKFYVYRKDSTLVQFVLIDSCTATYYTDTNVQNSMYYFYQVSAINLQGYEGPASNERAARPGMYSVIINQGASFTSSRQVTLSIIALEGTRFMQISNDSTFATATWEPLATTRNWELSEKDGNKKVYARFRDAEGNDTDNTIYDTIILDSQASILSLNVRDIKTFNVAGDTIRISMETGETLGKAKLDIGTQITGLLLHDDGLQGDSLKNDGIYSLNYVIPQGTDITKARFSGHFEDHLGNKATTFLSPTTISIFSPPSPVKLFKPEIIGTEYNVLHLTWSMNSDADFMSYKIYRSNNSLIDTTANLVALITAHTVTTFADSNLQENTTYFYRIYVTDTQGLLAGSNIVEGSTNINLPPAAVSLSAPIIIGERSISLSWEQSNEPNFSGYRLYRDETTDINDSGIPIFITQTRTGNYFQDNSVKNNTTYYYRVYVYDAQGKSAGSNTVVATTPENSPPQPSVLSTPTAIVAGSLRLTWSGNRDEDFDSYRIFRSKTSLIDSTMNPIVIISNRNTNSYDDFGLENSTKYYYRIFVFDIYGSSTGSNKVNGKTLP